jgi:hypothetical protein
MLLSTHFLELTHRYITPFFKYEKGGGFVGFRGSGPVKSFFGGLPVAAFNPDETNEKVSLGRRAKGSGFKVQGSEVDWLIKLIELIGFEFLTPVRCNALTGQAEFAECAELILIYEKGFIMVSSLSSLNPSCISSDTK